MYSKERSNFISGGLRVKQDCFAYSKELRTCKALNELYCLSGKCAFYKTHQERCMGCLKANKNTYCEECVRKGLK